MLRAIRNLLRLMGIARTLARHDALFPLEVLKIAPAMTAPARLLGRIGRRKAAAPKPVLFVEELTRALPDHTWLFHLQQDGTRVRLSGYTSDASSLIGLVDALPMFADPKFGSPVTHDPRREKDRFNLVVELITQSPEQPDNTTGAAQ